MARRAGGLKRMLPKEKPQVLKIKNHRFPKRKTTGFKKAKAM